MVVTAVPQGERKIQPNRFAADKRSAVGTARRLPGEHLPERGFALSISRRGEQLTIGVSGQLTPENYQRVKDALEEGCRSTPAPISIDLDMTEIEEVSDEIIVLLVKTAEECADLGVELRPSFHEVVRRAIEAAGYDEHLRPR